MYVNLATQKAMYWFSYQVVHYKWKSVDMIVPGKKPLIGSSIDQLHYSLKMEKLIKH